MSDIGQYGAGVDGYYWVKRYFAVFVPAGKGPPGTLRMVRLDENAKPHWLPRGLPWDDDAPTLEEAITHHLAGAFAAADAALEGWKQRPPLRGAG